MSQPRTGAYIPSVSKFHSFKSLRKVITFISLLITFCLTLVFFKTANLGKLIFPFYPN